MNHKDTEDTEIVQQNVFGFDTPDTIKCKIELYSQSLKILHIRLQTGQKIEFRGVEYFSGATSWTGANFKLYPRNECINLLTQISPIITQLIDTFKKHNNMDAFYWKLYSIPTKEGNIIQILAAIAHIVSELH